MQRGINYQLYKGPNVLSKTTKPGNARTMSMANKRDKWSKKYFTGVSHYKSVDWNSHLLKAIWNV